MTLNEFIKLESARLKLFAADWKNSMQEEPDSYPAELDSQNEWLEQYASFCGLAVETGD